MPYIMTIKRKRQGAFITFIGAVIFLLTIINDILHSFGVIHTSMIIPLGLLAFLPEIILGITVCALLGRPPAPA